MSTLIHHDGVFKEVDVIHIKHNGVWKEVSGKQYIPGMPMEGGFFGGFYALNGILYALIIADKSAEQSLRWKTSSFSSTGADSAIDGWVNTNAINNSSHPAAEYTRQYDGGGFNDWYLGSPQEIQTIASNLLRSSTLVSLIAPDFSAGGSQVFPSYFWTSQNDGSASAFRVNTLGGTSGSSAKIGNNPVRPIRKVPINL